MVDVFLYTRSRTSLSITREYETAVPLSDIPTRGQLEGFSCVKETLQSTISVRHEEASVPEAVVSC